MTSDLLKLRENIISLSKEKGVTVTKVASEIGIAKSTLHGWVEGVTPKNLNTIIKLAKYFGVTLNELLLGFEEVVENPLKEKFKISGRTNKNEKILGLLNDIYSCEIFEVTIKKLNTSN